MAFVEERAREIERKYAYLIQDLLILRLKGQYEPIKDEINAVLADVLESTQSEAPLRAGGDK